MEGMREVRTGRKEDALHSRLKMRLCVCVCARTHTHTHTCTCVRAFVSVCARVRACVMRARAHTHARTHVYMCARVCFCVRAMLLLPLSLLHVLPPSFSSSLVSANAAIQRDTRAMDEHLDTATVPRLFFRRNPPNRSPGPTTCPSPASAHVTTMRPCQAHWRGTTTHSCARIALHRRRVDLSAVSVARSSLLPRHAARALGTRWFVTGMPNGHQTMYLQRVGCLSGFPACRHVATQIHIAYHSSSPARLCAQERQTRFPPLYCFTSAGHAHDILLSA